MATTAFATFNARATGIVLVLVGIAGIALQATDYLGLFQFGDNVYEVLLWDYTHSTVHIVLGVIALAVGFIGRFPLDPVLYGRIFGPVYIVLGVAGFVDADLFGLGPAINMHLEWGENVIHLLLGGLGVVAGYLVFDSGEDPDKTRAKATSATA